MRVPGAVVRAWWCVRLPLEVKFLGFFRERSWSMSVVLVSSGEVGFCTNLKCLVTALLEFVGFCDSIEPWWLQGVVESRSNREACVTSDNGVHVIFFFAC